MWCVDCVDLETSPGGAHSSRRQFLFMFSSSKILDVPSIRRQSTAFLVFWSVSVPSIFVLKIIKATKTEGAKGDWDFRTSDLVKNPDGTEISVKFGGPS